MATLHFISHLKGQFRDSKKWKCTADTSRGQTEAWSGNTHVQRTTAPSGYRAWYCRQHARTLSSLFTTPGPPKGEREDRRQRMFSL